MGYCMTQEDSVFRIDHSKHKEALAAIKALKGKETCGTHFSWVSTEDFVKARTLAEAIEAWRWDVDMDEDYNIVSISFEGEKLGDDEVLFRAIAPFVEPGSFIEMRGEDGALWRWLFEETGFRQQDARVVWD